MRRGATQLIAVSLLTAALTAACSSSTAGSGSHSTLTTTSARTTAAAATVATSSSAASGGSTSTATPPAGVTTTTAHASVPECLDDIRVIPGTAQGAAGHIALVLIFNNVSTTKTCEIYGYPGVDLVNASGGTVAHLARTLRGMAGGEPAGVTSPQGVVLAPGQSASALAEASDVPQNGITDCGSYSLLVTPPDQTVSVPAGTAMLPRCAAEIHPVVPGTTGGMS